MGAAMAWPSWMPTAARPAGWTDWSEVFRKVIPREWPENLFGIGTQGMSDLIAFGESLALTRDLLEFMLRNLWPGRDTVNGLFLSRWEAVFDISPAATIDERANRIIASMRQRGTMTSDLVKAIMAPAFGSANPGDVVFESPTSADAEAAYSTTTSSDAQGVLLGTTMHIYSGATPPVEPDFALAYDLIERIKPTGDSWSVGKFNRLFWGVAGAQGSWDRATWG